MEKLLFISFFFEPENGVSALRSRHLSNLLRNKNFNLTLITKKTNSFFGKNVILWSVYCFFKILFNKSEKVYVSCGPFIPLVFILLAIIITRKKLIVDFRDPWSLNIKSGYGKQVKVKKWKVKSAEMVEKIAYKLCEFFIVCTPGMAKEYKKIFNDSKKLKMILNGFDFNSLDYSRSFEDKSTLRFVCLGKFAEYNPSKAEEILKELKNYVNEFGENSIEISFIGANERYIKPVITKVGLAKQVKYLNKLPYHTALLKAANADIGLSLVRNEQIEFGTKIYDYIGLGLPVYDSFDEEKELKKFFGNYLVKFDKKRIPFDQRKRFSRDNIWLENIFIFEHRK